MRIVYKGNYIGMTCGEIGLVYELKPAHEILVFIVYELKPAHDILVFIYLFIVYLFIQYFEGDIFSSTAGLPHGPLNI